MSTYVITGTSNTCTRLFIRSTTSISTEASDTIEGGSYQADTKLRTERAAHRPMVVSRYLAAAIHCELVYYIIVGNPSPVNQSTTLWNQREF
ncbi:unnamed protein product [Macrosiphum euphorbiae]|uniref:Uncharacterized protein n=1 Tax=Macrosiphum euphorbiae TaxID=13131 RepID=A0AAV0XVR4_9HEMI|nr:unnamed protein product [Macrosiphum euphorbiae]